MQDDHIQNDEDLPILRPHKKMDPLVRAGRDINVHDRGLTLINKFGQIIEISQSHNGNNIFLYLMLSEIQKRYGEGKSLCSGMIISHISIF